MKKLTCVAAMLFLVGCDDPAQTLDDLSDASYGVCTDVFYGCDEAVPPLSSGYCLTVVGEVDGEACEAFRRGQMCACLGAPCVYLFAFVHPDTPEDEDTMRAANGLRCPLVEDVYP
jgi:hypothetical protein